MKNYIKPTFTLAGLFPMALAASCGISETDKNRLEDWFEGEDWSKMFVDSGDDCQEDAGIEFFCKNQYTEDWKVPTVFNSF